MASQSFPKSSPKHDVIHHDYTPEKMVELLQEMKSRGQAMTVSETGELLNIDVAIKFYSGLCAASQTLRA